MKTSWEAATNKADVPGDPTVMADIGNASLPVTDTTATATSAPQPAGEDAASKKPKGIAGWFSSKKKNQDDKDADKKPEEKSGPPPVKFLELFRYANTMEKIFVLLASLAAAGHGAIMPLFTIIFGDVRLNSVRPTNSSFCRL